VEVTPELFVSSPVLDFISTRMIHSHSDINALRFGDGNTIANQGILRVAYRNISEAFFFFQFT
jgi:hypothetical protein